MRRRAQSTTRTASTSTRSASTSFATSTSRTSTSCAASSIASCSRRTLRAGTTKRAASSFEKGYTGRIQYYNDRSALCARLMAEPRRSAARRQERPLRPRARAKRRPRDHHGIPRRLLCGCTAHGRACTGATRTPASKRWRSTSPRPINTSTPRAGRSAAPTPSA